MLAFSLGALNILLDRRKRLGFTGISAAGLAVFLGGTDIQTETIGQTPYSLGLDWFVLALLVSAIIFIPLEKLYAKDPQQNILRPQWRTDLSYFFVSHMLVQFILIFVTASSTWLAGWVVSETLQAKVQSLPIVVQFVLAVFVADLGSTGCTACTTWCRGCGASMRCTIPAPRWTGWPARASISPKSC